MRALRDCEPLQVPQSSHHVINASFCPHWLQAKVVGIETACSLYNVRELHIMIDIHKPFHATVPEDIQERPLCIVNYTLLSASLPSCPLAACNDLDVLQLVVTCNVRDCCRHAWCQWYQQVRSSVHHSGEGMIEQVFHGHK
jgi:hypothetical protein